MNGGLCGLTALCTGLSVCLFIAVPLRRGCGHDFPAALGEERGGGGAGSALVPSPPRGHSYPYLCLDSWCLWYLKEWTGKVSCYC